MLFAVPWSLEFKPLSITNVILTPLYVLTLSLMALLMYTLYPSSTELFVVLWTCYFLSAGKHFIWQAPNYLPSLRSNGAPPPCTSSSLPCISQADLYNWMSSYNHSEKAMAPHSSTLAWKIPWTEEPGRLQSMGSLRVGHDWVTSLSLFTFMHWRRKWQPTPVFLPEESQGLGNLVGCHLWGHTESDTTEAT